MVDAPARKCIYEILRLRQQGATLQAICDRLNDAQVPAPRSTRWYCATVRKVIEHNAGLQPLLERLHH